MRIKKNEGNKMTKAKAETKQKKRADSNSNTSAINKFANAQTTVPLPSIVGFKTQTEIDLWEYITAARSYDDWRDIDLMMLWKWVQLEQELLKQQEFIEEEGAVVLGARGGPIENPRIRVMNLYEQRQLSIFRALGLNTTPSAKSVIVRNQAEEQKARRILDSADSLLAGASLN